MEPIKEILEELFSLLETLETRNIAVTQFLKDQGIATDEKLAPYLDRAGNASSVKWRAARARMQHLLSPIQNEKKEPEKEQAEKQQPEKQQNQEPQTKDSGAQNSATEKGSDKNAKPAVEENAKQAAASAAKTPPDAAKSKGQ